MIKLDYKTDKQRKEMMDLRAEVEGLEYELNNVKFKEVIDGTNDTK